MGIDGVGDGCFAGPIIYAGVILPIDYKNELIKDSKKINTESKREKIYDIILKNAIEFQTGIGTTKWINEFGINSARKQAIDELVSKFQTPIDYIIMDAGTHYEFENIPYNDFQKGDSLYLSIAAASIIAKVTRDRIMNELHFNENYKMYNFIKNKGYGTAEHRKVLKEFGLSDVHRNQYCKRWI